MDKKEIEQIFKISGSPDELFDAFRLAIGSGIKDEEIYKILLANKALSNDEIKMYAEKICKDFPELCPSIYFWTARVFESFANHLDKFQNAFFYYKKSISSDESDLRPYLAIARMYNNELDLPQFKDVTGVLLKGISKVDIKSKICFALSNLYKKRRDVDNASYYQMLGERYQRNEYQ
jgi:hypothetical protein